MNAAALVPLRGGSKSIPDKNIRPIAGKPLCAWCLQAAAQAASLGAVYVSTDSPRIRAVVEGLRLGVRVLDRPAELATDEASTEAVMLHVAEQVDFDYLVLLQATSPLTTAQDIDNALAMVRRDGLDSLVSGVRWKRFFWSDDGAPVNYDPARRPRRQEFPGWIMENGAIYVTRRETLLAARCRLGGKIGVMTMAPETALELDDPADWPLIEQLLLRRARAGGEIARRAAAVRLLALDVDGVLTDGAMYYSPQGEALKRFDTRDGHGIVQLRAVGVETAVITRESTAFTLRRCEKLGITEVYIGALDKPRVLMELAQRRGLSLAEIAYVGDDEGDVECLAMVGLPCCPADAQACARDRALLITERAGGRGAVREICDLIRAAKTGGY